MSSSERTTIIWGWAGHIRWRPDVTAIHPGADDNASGTAGVIELARWYAKQPKQKRGILFLNFAGEETGTAGIGLVCSASGTATR